MEIREETSKQINNFKTSTIKDSVERKNLDKILSGLTVGQVFGKSIWSNALQTASFASLSEFEFALTQWETVLQYHLIKHDFNTFGSYTEFYRDFPLSNAKPFDFYRDHEATLISEYLSCTGLAVYLLKSLQQQDHQQFGSYFALVSCERDIQVEANLNNSYDIESGDVVKRHVLVCIKFILSDSGRNGYVLFDSGYSIPRPIVVMQDESYPHTGSFTMWHFRKERHYKLVNDKFIKWEVSNIESSTEKSHKINLIYIEKEFQSYRTFSRKRGLISKIKVCVVRNRTGPVALFYSLVDKKNLIIVYRENGIVIEHHFSINDLDSDEVRKALNIVAQCSNDSNDQLSADQILQKYLQTLKDYRKSLYDTNFCSDMLQLDEWINARQQHIGYLH